jgi:adenine-specific DNA-methyltransferase
MDKMKMESPDMTVQNIDRIAALFPNCVTETVDEDGKFKRAINFELLKQMLSPDVVEGDERYEFTWVGKKAAIVEANKPIRKTLRPCKEESKNWDSTENLYIEGDNLEVLKLLQESYLGKVKMIYIDPPYNTGNDFIYADNFMRSQEEENEQMGMYDEDDNRLFKNTDTNGRFHSDWCSMIYSRLMLARNLLTNDGVIFISIDDNEQENLKKCCDEVLGCQNFVGVILWKKKTNGNNMGFLPPVHDYIFCYAKNIDAIKDMGYPVTDDFIAKTFSNPDGDMRGPWTTTDLSANHKGPYFAIRNPKNGDIHYPPKGRYWVFNEQEVQKRIEDGRIIFGKSGTGKPVQKVFLSSRKFAKVRADSWWANNGMNEDATRELRELFGESKLFTHPKPSKLIYHLCKISTEDMDIVLDFFSGSATTAHAVMQLNTEDGGHRKFIMVQLPEKCVEASEASKAGYKTICEIGKERIRRAGEKIKSESPLTTQDLDVGFRVLKLDDTNMKDVYYAPDDYSQGLLAGLESNIKEDRTDLDLLFGCLLDWGLPLSLPYSSEQIDGCTVHTYNDGDLIACFAENIPESVVKGIAKRQPLRAVFRDSSFANCPAKINVTEIFKLLAPDTRVKVI